jgi:serine/threonine protein kinase
MSTTTFSRDFYSLLQVLPNADVEVIKAAYRALMIKHHPDHTKDGGKMAARLGEAYGTLSDGTMRRKYDAQRNQLDGKIIGSFRVLRPLAEGGFGKTYRGEHILTNEPVCIKHCSEISPESEETLVSEAKAMWDLRHFAIPAVRDLLKLDDGSLALVMSFIPGLTLFQIVEKKGALHPEHVAWIAQRALNGLYYMHTNGVIHGDMKPHNIIIQARMHTLVLVDLGLAMVKPKHGDVPRGYTKVFAPPEQIDRKVLLPESDLYGLGMTMIYALTGDVDRAAAKRVPASAPDPLCEFIRRLIVRDPLARPRVWKEENLCDTIEEVRRKSFGRINSGMKPLEIDD